MAVRLALFVSLALAACPRPPDAPAAKRVVLNAFSGSTFELVPEPGQLPFCLAYTVSPKGVIRQLTMSAENVSFECPAGQPVGHHPFRVPSSEPSVKVLVLFSSQSVNASSVSQQLLETRDPTSVTAMGLRLPGQAALEVLDFTHPADAPSDSNPDGGAE
jgi:hypothetical protein